MEAKRIPQRTSISGTRNRLTVKNQDPAYFYRVVNDVDDRVEIFRELGYEVVMKDIKVGDKNAVDGTKLGTPVSVPVGGGMKAIVMRCPREIYDARQKDKADVIQTQEDALKTPNLNNADYGKVEIRR
ncbi:MAG: hypothetical protein NUV80_06430 [Candidatus Berkelbacteria bacterium]|nr:hypothetical protein [Candidatus Berkelbacteria bacterium]